MTTKPADSSPSLRHMLTIWLPMAASIVMMVLEPSVVNAALSRSRDAVLALAAYGVAYGLAILIESPIIMLLDASVARSIDRQAFASVRRFTIYLGLAVTANGLLISLTPLYSLIVEGLMSIPADVAAWARPTMQVLSFWPFFVAWRRAHQGVLIRTSKTGVITVATIVRLLVLSALLFGGLRLWPGRGAFVAGVSMVVSVAAEAALTTWATKRAPLPEDSAGSSFTLSHLWHFYAPLLATSVLAHTARPLVSTGIAAAAQPTESLATWSVIWSFALLIAGPAWSLQQLSTALVQHQTGLRRVRRFSLLTSLGLTVLLAVVALSPLYDVVLGRAFNLSADLRELGRLPMQVLIVYPLLTGALSLARGVLIRAGYTKTVRAATILAVATLGGTLLLGVARLTMTGVLLAATATLVSGVAELGWLIWRSTRLPLSQRLSDPD